MLSMVYCRLAPTLLNPSVGASGDTEIIGERIADSDQFDAGQPSDRCGHQAGNAVDCPPNAAKNQRILRHTGLEIQIDRLRRLAFFCPSDWHAGQVREHLGRVELMRDFRLIGQCNPRRDVGDFISKPTSQPKEPSCSRLVSRPRNWIVWGRPKGWPNCLARILRLASRPGDRGDRGDGDDDCGPCGGDRGFRDWRHRWGP